MQASCSQVTSYSKTQTAANLRRGKFCNVRDNLCKVSSVTKNFRWYHQTQWLPVELNSLSRRSDKHETRWQNFKHSFVVVAKVKITKQNNKVVGVCNLVISNLYFSTSVRKFGDTKQCDITFMVHFICIWIICGETKNLNCITVYLMWFVFSGLWYWIVMPDFHEES